MHSGASHLVHVLCSVALFTGSVPRQPFGHTSHQPLEFNTVDWLGSSESTELNYENNIEEKNPAIREGRTDVERWVLTLSKISLGRFARHKLSPYCIRA